MEWFFCEPHLFLFLSYRICAVSGSTQKEATGRSGKEKKGGDGIENYACVSALIFVSWRESIVGRVPSFTKWPDGKVVTNSFP